MEESEAPITIEEEGETELMDRELQKLLRYARKET